MADTKTSAESAAATLDGSELVRGVQAGGNVKITTQAIADLAPAGGLFGPVLSDIPTSAGIGLSTWLNQGGASVADNAIGVSITQPSLSSAHSVAGRIKAVPATPYTISALISMTPANFTQFTEIMLGWYDGTNKIEAIKLSQRTSAPSPVIRIDNYSTPTAVNANLFAGTISSLGYLLWVRIGDDGTTVSYSWSADGVNFKPLYSVAKASGYLGSSGYSNIIFGVDAFNAATVGSILSWMQG